MNVVEDNVRSKQVNDRNFSGLIHYGAGGADLDPAVLFDSAPLRPKMNTSHFESEEYARLVDAARLEPDTRRRKALYGDLTRLVKDEAFFLPVALAGHPRVLSMAVWIGVTLVAKRLEGAAVSWTHSAGAPRVRHQAAEWDTNGTITPLLLR